MISFRINLEVMIRVEAQRNETFRGWHEMQIRDTTLIKTNISKPVARLRK